MDSLLTASGEQSWSGDFTTGSYVGGLTILLVAMGFLLIPVLAYALWIDVRRAWGLRRASPLIILLTALIIGSLASGGHDPASPGASQHYGERVLHDLESRSGGVIPARGTQGSRFTERGVNQGGVLENVPLVISSSNFTCTLNYSFTEVSRGKPPEISERVRYTARCRHGKATGQ